MNEEWMKITKPKINQKVLLCCYRKVRGKKGSDDGMDELRGMLIGKEGIIVDIKNQHDISGCPLVWIQVEGKQLTWRVASLKKKRLKAYKAIK